MTEPPSGSAASPAATAASPPSATSAFSSRSRFDSLSETATSTSPKPSGEPFATSAMSPIKTYATKWASSARRIAMGSEASTATPPLLERALDPLLRRERDPLGEHLVVDGELRCRSSERSKPQTAAIWTTTSKLGETASRSQRAIWVRSRPILVARSAWLRPARSLASRITAPPVIVAGSLRPALDPSTGDRNDPPGHDAPSRHRPAAPSPVRGLRDARRLPVLALPRGGRRADPLPASRSHRRTRPPPSRRSRGLDRAGPCRVAPGRLHG